MTTPYDAAMRAAERRLDKVRRAIGKAIEGLSALEQAEDRAEATLRRECLLASDDHRLTTEFFFVRARDQRARLATQRAAAHAQLDELRRRAVACYGEQRVLVDAQARFHDDATRAEDAAQQAAIDDLIGARRARVHRTAPRTLSP